MLQSQPLNILITGGTGSLGTALVRRWYNHHNLTVLSRNPYSQEKLGREYPKVRFILADICNQGEVERACTGQDILLHAAALKQLSVGEYHPAEFARVNVSGSIVVSNAFAEVLGKPHPDTGLIPLEPRIALLISTDKAVHSLNTYGASKKIPEAVFRKRDYSVLRYGNVVQSRGSFLQYWKIAKDCGQPVEVREPEPTRFFLTLDGAVDLVEDTLNLLQGGADNGIFVPQNLKAFSIWDVADATGMKIETVPLLPYEKQHERLVVDGEIPVPETELLARIRPGWNDLHKGVLLGYQSEHAPRMTGQEFLEAVGWQS